MNNPDFGTGIEGARLSDAKEFFACFRKSDGG
jgi:hypothetical protein